MPFLALSVAQLYTPGGADLLRNIESVLSNRWPEIGPRGLSMFAWSCAVYNGLDFLVGVLSYVAKNPGLVRSDRDMYQLYQADLSVRQSGLVGIPALPAYVEILAH